MSRQSINRRNFLKASLVAGGAVVPYFVPGGALGAGGVSPSNKIVVGLWGTGSQGSGHVKGFKGQKGFL